MRYKCLTINDAKIGQIVILVNPGPHYVIGTANPAVSSRYECCGTVDRLSGPRISVRWDNGTQNTYINGELALAIHRKSILQYLNKWNPVKTKTGEYTSIWLKRIP